MQSSRTGWTAILFLSTPSARRATVHHFLDLFPKIFLSTPSARRATRPAKDIAHLCKISIHALREEGDVRTRSRCLHQMYFYPRPPRGGRPSSSPAFATINLFLSTPSARRATWRWITSATP